MQRSQWKYTCTFQKCHAGISTKLHQNTWLLTLFSTLPLKFYCKWLLFKLKWFPFLIIGYSSSRIMIGLNRNFQFVVCLVLKTALFSQVHKEEIGWEVEQLGLQCIHIWDVSTVLDGLAYYAISLAFRLFYINDSPSGLCTSTSSKITMVLFKKPHPSVIQHTSAWNEK